jgi:hypothetical protein
LVRASHLVMLDDLLQHVLQMAASEDQQMIQDLAPGCLVETISPQMNSPRASDR